MNPVLQCLKTRIILMGMLGGFATAEPVFKPYEADNFSLAEGKIDRLAFDALRKAGLEPNEAPPGIRLSPVRKAPEGMTFNVITDSTAPPGLETILIVEFFSKQQPAKKGGKVQQRYLIGTLPAIPISLASPTTP